MLVVAAFMTILLRNALPQESITCDAQHFDYDGTAALGVKEVSLQQRDGVTIPALIAQQVIDLRCGVDLLLSRSDVDPQRIAYVGHSWDAGTGAIDAIDKRIAAFVFMGGPQSNRQYVLFSDSYGSTPS